jgi:hypothetical protein
VSFVPVIPAGGIVGLRFLDRTMARQQAAHDSQPVIRRDEAHFRARIGSITTAEALVADRRLLAVALGAFGLEADLGNRFFIRRVLEDGTTDPRALANRLVDKRYHAFAAAFGFGDGTPHTASPGFADRILQAWRTRAFEAAVGNRDEAMRLVLNARRELAELAAKPMGEDARWFTLMGNPPLRRVVETAFRLPAAFGALDIDRQLAVFKERARATLGSDSVAAFADPDRVELLVRRFLVAAGAPDMAPAAAGARAALTLLQGAAVRRG